MRFRRCPSGERPYVGRGFIGQHRRAKKYGIAVSRRKPRRFNKGGNLPFLNVVRDHGVIGSSPRGAMPGRMTCRLPARIGGANPASNRDGDAARTIRMRG
ncbi:hypothetical protein [Allosphingosinicella indica]|uniref:hypothetical protein n=1 Tax=Allosphingosinicella indica TaxID=941907 RepID=UPI001AECBA35|nr:hypothetical protein [Allosphingosinicella indica]